MKLPDIITFDTIPKQALDWHQKGRGAVLATVVQTWGSAPRRVGAQLVVSGDGNMQGSVSGGCVEGAVVLEAQQALADGRSKILEFGISDGDAFAVGLACGGTIRILLEPIGAVLPEPMLKELVEARAQRRAVAYVVNIQKETRALEYSGHSNRMQMDRSGFEEDGQTFVTIHMPPLRLVVVGAVHIAQALLPIAQIVGFDPVVVDPRESFASPERFPDVKILNDWPDEALQAHGLDARTAVVLLTHDPKLDDPALELALRSEAFYIGALGSKRTHEKRCVRLQEKGFSKDQIARINGPVGLNIGAATPAEIAASIMAEMIYSLRSDG
mgnify:FL=1